MRDVIAANIEIHTALAPKYNADEPHFRPENQQKVRKRLEQLARDAPVKALLDVGCGTGFIINLAADLFETIDGIDITPAMLQQVNTSLGNITLHESRAEALPFQDETFGAASAYSFLDHLDDYGAMLREVARTLVRGGLFYIDLVPNRAYWQALGSLDKAQLDRASLFVRRENRMVTSNDRDAQERYGVDAETFRIMEPVKQRGGLDIAEFERAALLNGFKRVDVHFDWFLGQAHVMHNQSFADADVVNAYLQAALPATQHLFKYVWFVLQK